MKAVDFSDIIAASDLKVGIYRQRIDLMKICEYSRSVSFLDLLSLLFKLIIWKAQGVPQLNNVAHPKHPEEEETSPNRNHIITSKQQQTN